MTLSLSDLGMNNRHSATTARTLKAAVVGIGGFASVHHTALLNLENSGVVKLIATCDPRAGELRELQSSHRFEERGAKVYPDLESLLRVHGSDLDMVVVVSPINFHAEHHHACVERGIACYLEKPPTLDPDELEDMIACDGEARLATQVGFNYIIQPWRQRLKKRVLEGEFGPLLRVAFHGAWRRSVAYYRRNKWAGRLMLGDYILLDSCCGNAMSHFVHNMLFHAGTNGMQCWAEPESIEAELYRANDIEGADTVFARGSLHNGVEFFLALTHACESAAIQEEIVECKNARIEIPPEGPGTIYWSEGRTELFETDTSEAVDFVKENLERYCGYLAGRERRPLTTLADARPFVRLNALLYLAARNIHTVVEPYAACLRGPNETNHTMQIPGIEAACGRFARTGLFPSATGAPWGRGGGKAKVSDLPGLRDALEELGCCAANLQSAGI